MVVQLPNRINIAEIEKLGSEKFTREAIDMLLLNEIAREASCGYEIRKRIHKLYGFNLRFNIVYSHLEKLDQSGHITLKSVDKSRYKLYGKKLYEITSSGIVLLNHMLELSRKADVGSHTSIKFLEQLAKENGIPLESLREIYFVKD